MLSVINAFKIIGPYKYMAAIDLTDPFFSIPIHPTHPKYLKFIFYFLFQLFHACRMDMDLLKESLLKYHNYQFGI